MKTLAMLAMLQAINSCAAPAKPAPTTTTDPAAIAPDISERDAEAKRATCATACANVVGKLHCAGWIPDGSTCELGCAQIIESLGASALSLSCVQSAKTCAASGACLK